MDHGTRADQHRAVWNRVVWNAAALVCAGQAHAADLTFDANGASPPDPVGTGAWETTAASWFDGAGFHAWDNTGLHRAVFGAPGTVTLATPIVAGSLDFRADTTLSGSYLLTLAGTRGITLGEHATAAISAPLTGGFRLSGAATGLLQITGNNAGLYAGTTVLGRGPRLQLGHASALGSATHADALVLEDGARLEFANAATYAYDYTLTGGTARIVPRASSGVFSGAPTLTAPTTLVYGAANTGSQDWKGRLADTGPHALSFTVEAAEGYGPTLFAPNAWSGDTRLRSGQLALANAAALSPDTAVVFDGIGEVQATLVFNYGGTFARTLGHGPGQFRWEGSGGFRSNVGTMTVSFDGGVPLTWGAGGFPMDARCTWGAASC